MDFVGKQLLWILIIEHFLLLVGFFLYARDKIAALLKLNRLETIIANQEVLGANDASLKHDIEISRTICLQVRDHCSDIKQSIEALNGLNKEAIRNLPKKDGLA